MKDIIPLTIILLLFNLHAMAQNKPEMSQDKVSRETAMDNLSFMIGDWVGTSKGFSDGVPTSEVPAFQKISYDLNKGIVVIQLHSETLLLHTIIYYDEEDQIYYYNAYRKTGASRLPAKLVDGRLVVSTPDDRRFIFSRPTPNTFQEYGEKWTDGTWVKTFEDNFKDMK